jgi:hypothetical protein
MALALLCCAFKWLPGERKEVEARWAGNWTAHRKEIKRKLGWLLSFQIGKSRFFIIFNI